VYAQHFTCFGALIDNSQPPLESPQEWRTVAKLVSRRTFSLLALAFVTVGAPSFGVGAWSGPAPPSWEHPFSDESPFNAPVTTDQPVDPKSGQIVGLLADPAAVHVAIFDQFGAQVYRADSSTPRHKLRITNEPGWGINSLSQSAVPIPAGAVASPGSDRKLIVVDVDQGKVFDLWQAQQVNGQWTAAWGGVYNLDGTGSSPNPLYVARPHRRGQPASRATGSGISTLAGLVRRQEVHRGSIDHALVFATDVACGPAQDGPFRFPATTTDGVVTDGLCIPEGTRIQLDPSLKIDSIKGMSRIQRMLAHALQTYGAFCTDNGGARMSLAFERPRPGDGAAYRRAGLEYDSMLLSAIPWGSLRVLTPPASS
jgi:hypothetical protein